MTTNTKQSPKCTYCDDPATGYTIPPMCEAHEELLMMIEYLNEGKIEITDESLIDLARRSRANNGSLTISDEDILTMWPRVIDESLEFKYVDITPQ